MIWDVFAAIAIVGVVLFLGSLVMVAIDATVLNGELADISLKFFIVGCALFAVGIIPIMIHEEEQNKNACEAAGGHYVVVRTETQYVMIDKVMIPQEIEIYGCVKGE